MCVIQEDHGVARANAEQGNRYVDTSDNEEIQDDSISIPDQDHLDTEVVKLLAVNFAKFLTTPFLPTSYPAHLFAIRGRRKRGPGTL